MDEKKIIVGKKIWEAKAKKLIMNIRSEIRSIFILQYVDSSVLRTVSRFQLNRVVSDAEQLKW